MLFRSLPSTAAVAQARPDLTALATIHSLAQIGGFVKDWCDARAPKTKPTTDKGLAEWRRAFRLDEIETRFGALDSNQRSQIDSAIETKRADAFRGQGEP